MSDASPRSNQRREDLNAALPDHFCTQAVLQGFDVDFLSCYCTNLSKERQKAPDGTGEIRIARPIGSASDRGVVA